jgi:hypothetical protein
VARPTKSRILFVQTIGRSAASQETPILAGRTYFA